MLPEISGQGSEDLRAFVVLLAISLREWGRFYENSRNETNRTLREIGGNNRRVLRAGYTSAVDMWSLGCLTTALFIGQSYFTPTSSVHDARKSSEIIRAAAAMCDLSRLDHGSEWSAINSRVKDFIKSCLSLDETERPTAKEALLHHWFSAGYCKGNSRRQYEDIIKGWKPVQPAEDFAEDLRLGIDASIPKNDVERLP